MTSAAIRPGRRCATALAVLAATLALPSAAHARSMAERMRAACADDARKLCPGRAPGSDELEACLLANRSRVSAACMTFVGASG